MAVEVTMPQMGADMTEGTVVKWLKSVGDEVTRGDVIAEIETDKANIELEAYESGTLSRIVVAEGETVAVGEVIALLGDASDTGETAAPPAETQQGGAEEQQEHTPERKPLSGPAERHPETPAVAQQSRDLRRTENEGEPDGRIRISPVARRIASENSFDYRQVQGTGPGGRILRRDIEEAIASAGQAQPASAAPAAAPAAPAAQPPAPAPAPRAERTEPEPVQGLSRIRRTIARRMSQSKQEQPHYYLTLDIDMTEALAFRKQLNAQLDDAHKVTINDLIIKACAVAIERHPKFNASFSDDGLIMHDQINIDLGVALEEGLIAVSVLNVGSKSLGRIAVEAKDVIQRARDNRLRPEQYGNGTFTITNLGNYGVETLIGIINPPQAAILGVGSVMPQPVVRNDEIVIRQIMKVALSADHRVSDGAEGAQFIKEIQGVLENPALLTL